MQRARDFSALSWLYGPSGTALLADATLCVGALMSCPEATAFDRQP
jgi:hypothetical protein